MGGNKGKTASIKQTLTQNLIQIYNDTDILVKHEKWSNDGVRSKVTDIFTRDVVECEKCKLR